MSQWLKSFSFTSFVVLSVCSFLELFCQDITNNYYPEYESLLLWRDKYLGNRICFHHPPPQGMWCPTHPLCSDSRKHSKSLEHFVNLWINGWHNLCQTQGMSRWFITFVTSKWKQTRFPERCTLFETPFRNPAILHVT